MTPPIPPPCPMLEPGEHTSPNLPLRDEIRKIAREAALLAAQGFDENGEPVQTRKRTRWDQQAVVMVLLAIVGGIFWAARLEGRVNASDTRAGAIEASVVRIEDEIAKSQEPIIRRLDRMENKMDQLLGEGRRR